MERQPKGLSSKTIQRLGDEYDKNIGKPRSLSAVEVNPNTDSITKVVEDGTSEVIYLDKRNGEEV